VCAIVRILIALSAPFFPPVHKAIQISCIAWCSRPMSELMMTEPVKFFSVSKNNFVLPGIYFFGKKR
jgi:hypothetical protein